MVTSSEASVAIAATKQRLSVAENWNSSALKTLQNAARQKVYAEKQLTAAQYRVLQATSHVTLCRAQVNDAKSQKISALSELKEASEHLSSMEEKYNVIDVGLSDSSDESLSSATEDDVASSSGDDISEDFDIEPDEEDYASDSSASNEEVNPHQSDSSSEDVPKKKSATKKKRKKRVREN